ncbi:MATE family efflux transporter [Streptococcus gallinaceus]|uniref:MATE family efflux transporter n=1 Tax=Streptococcus gallinaceus TaxID=165758 RepID=UPI0020A2088F|nr:MATE family efflux transporter [Streptococcus gallinaceus]
MGVVVQIRKILQLALPVMAENFLQMLMGMVDGYLVAFLGLATISGVSVANNILSIYQAIFLAFGAAISALVAQKYGQKDQEQLAGQALFLTFLVSLVLGLLSIVGGERLLLLLGTDADVARVGGLYLALVGGGIIFLGLMTSLGSILRASGHAQLPMYVSLLSNVINVVLSAVFVFVFKGGVVGVAIGTLLARALAVAILWRQLPIKPDKLFFNIHRDLVELALPAAGERLMMRAGDVVIVALIVSLGTAVVAGNAIGETLIQFNYMPGMGIATATVILVANARGQGKEEEVAAIIRWSFLLALGLMAVTSCLIFFLGPWLTGFYTTDQVAIKASLLVTLYSFLGIPATAGTLIYTAFWQGYGNAKLPFYATSLGMWVVRIGLGYVLTRVWFLGLAGVWIATIADNVFRWAFLYFLSLRKFKISLREKL